jgi:hypothetical protein
MSRSRPATARPETKVSALDAAAEKIIAQKLWKSTGKTPAATLHAALIREIRDKKGDSRFKKTGRGRFAVAKR